MSYELMLCAHLFWLLSHIIHFAKIFLVSLFPYFAACPLSFALFLLSCLLSSHFPLALSLSPPLAVIFPFFCSLSFYLTSALFHIAQHDMSQKLHKAYRSLVSVYLEIQTILIVKSNDNHRYFNPCSSLCLFAALFLVVKSFEIVTKKATFILQIEHSTFPSSFYIATTYYKSFS